VYSLNSWKLPAVFPLTNGQGVRPAGRGVDAGKEEVGTSKDTRVSPDVQVDYSPLWSYLLL